jgi:hypothetical protein
MFKKGQSGNPAGRPRGVGKIGKLRSAIEAQAPDIIATLIEQARGGDVQAARLLLERTIPALKPVDLPAVAIAGGDSLAVTGGQIIAAMTQGTITPQQAGDLLAALAQQARIVETVELEQRITRLEEMRK